MIDTWISSILVLAQEDAAPPPEQPGAPNFLLMLVPVILIMLLFQFMFNPRKRDEKRRAEMMSTLKKNDRIVTIGGICGTVANISEDHQYVTIKVEDNTRIKMLASSIQTVIGGESKEEAGDAAKAG